MGFFKNLMRSVGKSVSNKTIETSILKTYSVKSGNRELISTFSKKMTWKLYSNRIESTDKFELNQIMKTALIKSQSDIPYYLVFKVLENSNIDAVTVTDDEITIANIKEDEILVFAK